MLGWLNVAQRHDFMLGILVHKCLYGLVPHYLSDNLTQLRDMEQQETCSSEQHILYVPFAKTSYFNKSFSVNGPRLWNSFSNDLTLNSDFNSFKHFILKENIFYPHLKLNCCFKCCCTDIKY